MTLRDEIRSMQDAGKRVTVIGWDICYPVAGFKLDFLVVQDKSGRSAEWSDAAIHRALTNDTPLQG